MTDQKFQQENRAEKEGLKIQEEKSDNEKAPRKMSAGEYIERSLADPTFGDSRRDELALAALKFSGVTRARGT